MQSLYLGRPGDFVEKAINISRENVIIYDSSLHSVQQHIAHSITTLAVFCDPTLWVASPPEHPVDFTRVSHRESHAHKSGAILCCELDTLASRHCKVVAKTLSLGPKTVSNISEDHLSSQTLRKAPYCSRVYFMLSFFAEC